MKAMKILGGLILAIAVLAFFSIFIVKEVNQAIVLQFGDPKRIISKPGLNFKIPFIQNVVYLDKRILNLDTPPEEVIASDQKRLIVDAFARFKIVDSYLYAIDFSDLYVFDISVLGTASQVSQQSIGWQIETIFNKDDYLYIGSQNGMLIFNIENRSQPEYASEITHWRGCDPVVVDGDYAYLTLRGGNECGQELSILEVINVADKYNPYTVRQYTMQEPYGLGVKEDLLFVSDGSNGFQIYDKTNPEDLELLRVIEDINVFDVIPLQDRLLAIADNVLYQYAYEEEGLSLISEFVIN